MKEHGDGSAATRGLLHPTSSPHLSSPSSDKIIRDQELHHLVTSSIPSPPYHHSSLSLLNASAALVLDPIYSTHLLASLAAANANANNAAAAAAAAGHFQLPLSIPLALNPATHQHHLQPHLHHQHNMFHHLPATAPPTTFAGLPGATLPNQAQLDILSSWVANSDDKKITSTTSSIPNCVVSTGNNKNGKSNNNKTKSAPSNRTKKNGDSQVVNAKNNKNIQNSHKNNNNNNNNTIQKQKRSGATSNNNNNNKKNGKSAKSERMRNGNLLQLNEGIVSSSENELPTLKDSKVMIIEKEPMMTINESIIQPYNFGSPPVTPKSGKKGDSRAGSPHHNNNNNTISNLKGQTSPGSGSQNGGPRDKVFTCPTCHRGFGYKHVLQNHERTHTGEKPFECSICNKKFTRDHHLKTHMRLHTGEKPYQCTHCDRQFVQVANLRRHLRVHTGERPYSCELCSSRFSDSNQLKAHMLIHKGEKPYSCTECGNSFRRRHHLAHHKCSSSSPDTSEDVMASLNSSMSSSSPPQLLTPSSTGGGDSRGTGCESGGKGIRAKEHPSSKRERKCRETRRIIRLESIPVAAQPVGTNSNGSGGMSSVLGGGGDATPTYLPIPTPEQDHPEDLSMSGLGVSALRVRHYSGSSSSATASSTSTPSPRGPAVMLLSTSRPYSSSSSFGEETPDLYASDEDLRAAADSSTNGKIIIENELSSMSD